MMALNGADPLNGPRQWGSLLFCLVIVLSLQRAEGSTEETGSSYTKIRILPLGAVERLNLRLLIDRQHEAVGRRIEKQTDNLAQLGGKGRILRKLRRPHPVRHQAL